MDFCIEGFLGKQHSWSVVNQHIARELIQQGHNIDLSSTNGNEFLPTDLISNFRPLKSEYDCQISYTAMINFPNYLCHGRQNRFGIWNYEFTKLPSGQAKFANVTDYFLPSSKFSYEIFANNGVSEEKMRVVHHGIDPAAFNVEPFKLNTKKSFKILANIAQPHIRKNLSGLLNAFGKAFNKNDDVCLVLKVVDKKPDKSFEVSFAKEYAIFNQKFPNHAECLVIKSFITNIESLYKSVDCVFTMTHAECFYLPGLEGLFANNIVISPRYGGQLDYLNDDNSLLIDGKMIVAPQAAQYWEASKGSEMFDPNIDDAVEKLRFAYQNSKQLKEKFIENSKSILPNFTWKKVVKDIVRLIK
jgi:glycosyltransferase involved in cell wall biosynthesis